jgi:hypothetical protein
MSRLRVVTGDDTQPEVSFSDAARSALEAALASGACAVVILYETPKTIGWAPVPGSDALARGMVDTVRDLLSAPAE